MNFKSIVSIFLNVVKYIVLLICLYMVIFRFLQGRDAYSFVFNDTDGYLISGYVLILIAFIWYSLSIKNKI